MNKLKQELKTAMEVIAIQLFLVAGLIAITKIPQL